MDISIISSNDYNALPHINEAHQAFETQEVDVAREQLLNLISEHSLNAIFSVHLLHKHSDVPEGKVMVYELVRGHHPTFRVLVPRSVSGPKGKENPAVAKYFFATASSTMKAYEYSREPMPNIEQHRWFFPVFAQLVLDLEVQDIFCLGVIPLMQLTGAMEIELPEFHSTVFVQDLELPGPSTITDWVNPAEALDLEGMGIQQAKVRGSRCAYARVGHSAAGFFDSEDGGRRKLCVDGMEVDEATPAYGIITNAMEYVAVA